MDTNLTGTAINSINGAMTRPPMAVPFGPDPFASVRPGSLAQRTKNLAQCAGTMAANNPRSILAGAAILAAGLLFANRRKALRGIDVALTTVTAPVREAFGWGRDAIHRATGPSMVLVGPGASLNDNGEPAVLRRQQLNGADAQTDPATA